MLSVHLSSLKFHPDKTASGVPSVFHLESGRLVNGQSAPRILVHKVGSKYRTQKTGEFQANLTFTDPSQNSARLLRMAESQMKRKAFVTQSPFDRGLLLGRRAFLF